MTDVAGNVSALRRRIDVACRAAGRSPEAVRLGLGAPQTQEELAHGLAVIADLLAEPPALSSRVV